MKKGVKHTSEPASGADAAQGETQGSSGMLVVVGSSAGGIEALKVLVASLRPDFPAPVILAQHLDPNRVSNLGVILERSATVPVVQVTGRTELQPGKVYVIPANHHVEVTDGVVDFQDARSERPQPSVDLLLSSAAAVYGERLVAVILTGSGSDGAVGAVDVKDAGGTVVIQNPASARYPSMPLALPPTVVDHVADLEAIGPLLYDLTRQVPLDDPQERSEDALQPILEIISKNTNIDFRAYKSSTILRRIARRMSLVHCNTLQEYAGHLAAHREEVTDLATALLIKVTEFFRDPETFEYLRAQVLPDLIEKARRRGRVLRLWSAGCATGEEPYSLALLLADLLGAELPEWNIKIFATDLDEGAIAFARRGLYPPNVLKKVPADLRTRFFEAVDHGLQITKPLRQLVIFGVQDISRGVPFPRIDLAICRNLLIYFKPELQHVVLDLFAYSLQHSNGYLFLGKAETARPSNANYEQVDKRWKVYRCISGPVPGSGRHASAALRGHGPPGSRGAAPRGPVARQPLPAVPSDAGLDLDIGQLRRFNELLLRSLPVGMVVIDHAYRIVSINAAGRRFLGIRDLAFEHDFLHSARALPYAVVRNAIDTVFRERTPTTLHEVPLEPPPTTATRWLSLTLMPAQAEAALPDLLVISVIDTTAQVVMRQRLEATQQEQAQLVGELSNTNKRLNEVNKELQDANEELQATNEEMTLTQEELQSTNEELEATNEEFQSTNEELETNNEELQATNEELNTTNEELGARTSELQEFTRRLGVERTRLAEMVELAPFSIAMLGGPNLLVEALNVGFARLIDRKDVLGLSVDAALEGAAWAPLVALVREAYRDDAVRVTPWMRTAVPGPDGVAREVYYQYTVVPTHEGPDKVSGVAVYAEDMSAQIAREAEELREQFKLMIEHSEQIALGLYDAQTGQLLQASSRYLAMLQCLRGDAPDGFLGRSWSSASPLAGQEDGDGIFREAVEKREPRRIHELRLTVDARETVWDMSLVPLSFAGGSSAAARFVVVSAVEVTEQVRAREEVERIDRMKDEFLSLASHELRTPMATIATYAELIRGAIEADPSREGSERSLARLRDHVQKFTRQIAHLNRLVDDLLDVARLESGKFTLHTAPVDLKTLVAQVVEELGLVLKSPPIRLDSPPEGTSLVVIGDEGRLRQVVTNLLTNAAHHAGEGSSIDVCVRRNLNGGPPSVEVVVRDYGPGIAPEQQELIFSRFYQARQGTKKGHGGLGLGLYMCRQILLQHGGSIHLESAPGEGATFTARIPLAGERALEAKPS